MINKPYIDMYLSAGKNLTLLDGKCPTLKDWVNESIDNERLYNHIGNLGWVLGSDDLVVDVDPRNGGDESYRKLLENLNIKLEPTVTTPSGGFHIYLKIPDKHKGSKFRKTLKEYPGIDFLKKGNQCVIAGSSTKKGQYEWCDKESGFIQSVAPDTLMDLLLYRSDTSNKPDVSGSFEAGNSTAASEKKVREALAKLDPSMPNDDWVKVGMALKEWGADKGLKLWEEWSKYGANYTEGETAKRWKSFKIDGEVSLGTLFHMADEAEFDTLDKRKEEYIEKIKLADLKTLELDICKKLRKEQFTDIQREQLVTAIKSRFYELNAKVPIGDIREKVSNTGNASENNQAPEWCKDWCYVNSHNSYVNLKTLEKYKKDSFNLINGKNIPASESGYKPPASKYVADRSNIETVNAMLYMPTVKKVIFEKEGKTYVNSFNPNTIPVTAKEYTEEGIEAIELIKKHTRLICGSKENADILTQWLAHQIQYPGQKILWAPIIQGIQGVGKSFFGELLRVCLGDKNIGTVSPTQITGDFNGWAINASVNILEEMRVKGHNRYETVNALKPLITDRIIQVNQKGIDSFTAYNVTNYICFTNHKDAIPMDEDDRRWWVVFVEVNSLDELEEKVAETTESYFYKLFETTKKYASEVRKWFLEYEITEEFLSTKQAPMTDYKKAMIAMEESNIEGLEEVRELIEKGGMYYNKDCISSSDLFKDFSLYHYNIIISSPRQKNDILKKLGYTLNFKSIKIDGDNKKVWTKRSMSKEEVRMLIGGNNRNTNNNE